MTTSTKNLSTNTISGFYAVWCSLFGVMSVLHAINHDGVSSLLVGWGGFVVATLGVFLTHTWSFDREKSRMSDRSYLVLFAFIFVIQLVIITDTAGVWDAR